MRTQSYVPPKSLIRVGFSVRTTRSLEKARRGMRERNHVGSFHGISSNIRADAARLFDLTLRESPSSPLGVRNGRSEGAGHRTDNTTYVRCSAISSRCQRYDRAEHRRTLENSFSRRRRRPILNFSGNRSLADRRAISRTLIERIRSIW